MTLTTEQLLHERSIGGEVLTAAEQSQLERWYRELGRQTAVARAGQAEAGLTQKAEQAQLQRLEEQVADLLRQIDLANHRLQTLSAQNKELRRDIAILRLKTAQQVMLEAA